MMKSDVKSILLLQLNNWWNDLDSDTIASVVPEAMEQMEQNFQAMPSQRFYKDGKMVFSPYHSVTWSIFLFRVAKLLSNKGAVKEADAVYYLNKIMNSVDWYHGIDLPIHFMAEHPLGSVLGRAKYGDYFFVYQGTTVGGNRIPGWIAYPIL